MLSHRHTKHKRLNDISKLLLKFNTEQLSVLCFTPLGQETRNVSINVLFPSERNSVSAQKKRNLVNICVKGRGREKERKERGWYVNNSQSSLRRRSLYGERGERGNKLQAEMKQDDRCQMNKTSVREPEIVAGSWTPGLAQDFSFSSR